MNIQEGPFQNFKAIHFPAVDIKMAGVLYGGFLNDITERGLVSYAEFSGDAANLGRYLRGSESGFYIDTLNIPQWPTGRAQSDVFTATGSTINPHWRGPYYNHLTGALYGVNDRPFIGVLRKKGDTGSSPTFPTGAVHEWHYCPEYSIRYSELTWNEAGADVKTISVTLTPTNGGGSAPAVEVYDRTYDRTVTTLEATCALLAGDVNASSYVSASYVGGTSIRVENTDAEEPFYVTHGVSPSTTGILVPISFTGTVITPAPAYGFQFNGIQVINFGTIDYDQAESISFLGELPTP